MNRVKDTLDSGKEILNIYFTAGYPDLDSVPIILKTLKEEGVDLVELGIPFSDPMADGPTIQNSSQIALANGMTVDYLFNQLQDIPEEDRPPLIAMGYLNQMMQYGVEEFLKRAKEVGIDSLIVPDISPEIYEIEYQDLFGQYQMGINFLITPQTSEDRIRKAAQLSTHFLYVVSSSSITGGELKAEEALSTYYNRVISMNLSIKKLLGFGIRDKASYKNAIHYFDGAIIGSAFIKAVSTRDGLVDDIRSFIKAIR